MRKRRGWYDDVEGHLIDPVRVELVKAKKIQTARTKTCVRLDATGKTGPRPRTGVADSDPIADRIVTNVELRRLGHWK
jgi:hypothetical protein